MVGTCALCYDTISQTIVTISLSLLGEMRVWLEQKGEYIAVPIKSCHGLELLAYMATQAPTRASSVSQSRILAEVFEHSWPRADHQSLRHVFLKYTHALYREVNKIAQDVGLPEVTLFDSEKIAGGATRWWLSDAWKVEDLVPVRHLHAQMEAAREQGATGVAALTSAAYRLIRLYQSYQGDFLEKYLAHGAFGDATWARGPFTMYRDMYLQALWNAAVIEHNASMRLSATERERSGSARRAASLYRTYALYAPKHRQFNLNAHRSRRQSERALRGFLRMCFWLADPLSAGEVYTAYAQLMAVEYPEWMPEQDTLDILRAVGRPNGALLKQLTPSEPEKH